MSKSYIYAIATLSGSTIGVGLFALPYVASKVGIFTIIGYFFILGFTVAIIHLIFADISLKTPDFIRLPSFAKIYLGQKWKTISLISSTIGLMGVSLAYIIVGGKFLNALLSPVIGGSYLFYALIYFISGATFIYFGIKAIDKIELLGVAALLITLIFLFLKGLPYFNLSNILVLPRPNDIFLPYGPILFSLWSLSLIPEIEEMLGKNKKLLPKVVLNSILIASLVYLFFIFVIGGISGSRISPTAIDGLPKRLGQGAIDLALGIGIITTFTSFVTASLTLKKIFWYDLKINKNVSWFIVCITPLMFFLLGLRSFIPVIGLVGAVMFGINGIIVLMMYQKWKGKQTQALTIPLILLLSFGIIYEFFYLIK